jgi:methylenetetrahydrofolate dehydrogenase (NADP+)/methenyltetrahydrofolate cyclohydrolase
MAEVIDGKAIADKIRKEIIQEIGKLKKTKNVTPGLAVIMVGQNEASKIYVRNKINACGQVGIQSFHHALPSKTPQEEVIRLIQKLNRDPKVHGILVQLPLPGHIKPDEIVEAIDPKKDVDGLHPYNLGRLSVGKPVFIPCTPAGIMRILKEIDYDCDGKEAVIVGRSNIVGKPMAYLLLAQNATVSMCHSHTKDLLVKMKLADIIIAAAGMSNLVEGAWVKKGAVVIDVGINRSEDGRLVGDVDFEPVEKVAGYITPVPGGVGPMTIAMLLWNTLEAAKRAAEGKKSKTERPKKAAKKRKPSKSKKKSSKKKKR